MVNGGRGVGGMGGGGSDGGTCLEPVVDGGPFRLGGDVTLIKVGADAGEGC